MRCIHADLAGYVIPKLRWRCQQGHRLPGHTVLGVRKDKMQYSGVNWPGTSRFIGFTLDYIFCYFMGVSNEREKTCCIRRTPGRTQDPGTCGRRLRLCQRRHYHYLNLAAASQCGRFRNIPSHTHPLWLLDSLSGWLCLMHDIVDVAATHQYAKTALRSGKICVS